MSLQELDFNYKLFFNKTTMVYGETGTGKSFVIADILYKLNDHIDQIIVISPTDRQNHTYDNGLVPVPFIHYNIDDQLLNNIWERQEALVTTYERVNNIDTLSGLFEKIPNINNVKSQIAHMQEQLITCRAELADCKDASTKITEMDAEYKKLLLSVYKKYIHESASMLLTMDLTADELYAI
jgi:DNA repair ATPase RecN